MRANRGFTLLELMVVLVIVAIVGGLVIGQGRSGRRNAKMAGGAYELVLRLGGLKARAMADGREYVLVVADTVNPAACAESEQNCGRILVFKSPVQGFDVAGFGVDPPYAGVEYVMDGASEFLPRDAQLALPERVRDSTDPTVDPAWPETWRAPPPFDTVRAHDPAVLRTCAGGRRCFGIRFLPDGEVRPVVAPNTPIPAGFAFVLRQFRVASAAAEKRAIFVSFPAGIVKTAAFSY